MSATQVESVEWLNAMVVRMWPHIDQAVAKVVKEFIEPTIQQTAPSLLRGLRFDRVSLGAVPLRIDAIHAIQPGPTAVTLLVDVHYAGEPDIQLAFKGLHLGIRRLTFKGRLSLAFTPLVGELPIVAAAHASFANVPQLEFDLTGLAGVADVPHIHPLLRQAVLAAITAQLVLPNRLTFKLGTDHLPGAGDFFALGYTPPRLLRLTVVEARNLKNTDDAGVRVFFKSDVSDPYAIVCLGAERFTTPTVNNNLNPTWNATHNFLVHSDAQAMDVYVMDEDHLDGDDELGAGRLTVADLVRQGDVWLDLGAGSAVHLKGDLFALQPDGGLVGSRAAGATHGVLSVLVDQAFGVPTGGGRTALVRASLGGVTRATTAVNLFRQQQKALPGAELQYETVEVPEPNPEWEQALEFLADDPAASLQLELVADGSALGSVAVPLAELLAAPDLTLRRRFDLSDGAGGLFLTLHLYGLTPADVSTLPPPGADPETDGSTELWLAFLLRCLWPHVDEAAGRLVREQILPTLRATVPVPITCERLSLGPQPPVVQNFRLKGKEGDPGVHLAFDVAYDGDCDILFRTAGVSFGLKKLVLKGTLHLILQPLVGQVPVAGAAQLYFVNPPLLQLDFQGLTDVLDWPVVGKAFRQVLKAQLQQFVLPQRQVVHLVDDLPGRNLFWELYQPPAGVLRVTVAQAKGLKNADSSLWSYFKADSSDAYCLLSLGDTTHTTYTVNNCLDPVWKDQTFDFVIATEDQRLAVEIYDDDTTNADDLLGRAEVSCRDLIAQKDAWLPLTEGPGELRLTAEWFRLKGDREALLALPEGGGGGKPQALLTVLVDQATGLPTAGLTAARVEVAVGPATKTTRAVPLTKTVARDGQQVTVPQPDPDWEEALTFPVPAVAGLVVRCSVTGGAQPVGSGAVAVADVLAQGRPDGTAVVMRQQLPLTGPVCAGATLSVTFMVSLLEA
eukprot:EG_transcript_1740